jgi:succinate-semialdehyde dehydrogenase/glutarate-semialdehyde dehydrogenase
MRAFVSRNPYNGQLLKEFSFISDSKLQEAIDKSYEAFQFNKKSSTLKSRADKLVKLADLIDQNVEKYAKLMTLEMGKPITSTLAEVKKSSGACRYYAQHVDKFYRAERVKTEATKTLVEYHPIGTVYHLTPFNFPFWICFKGVVPGILLGNSYIHRNSDSTPLTAVAIEELFKEAGFDSGEFLNVFSTHEQADLIMANQKVRGLCFTGSSRAGGVLGSIAAKYCKKSVMELGGNDGFLVV